MNRLRNIAKSQAFSNFVFYNDVDLIPVPGLYEILLRNLKIESEHTILHQTVSGTLLIMPINNNIQLI